MKAVSCCIAALLSFAVRSAAQVSGQVPYIETLEVRVHNIDVVVTDAKGVPVTGLGQSDFELFENGVAKPITNFSAFAESAAPPSHDAPQRADVSPTTPRPPRRFIFYLDDMAMVSATQEKLREQVSHLIDTLMEPGDEAMLLRPAEEKKLTSPFTSDREAIRRALDDAIRQERWRAGGPLFSDQRRFEIEMRGVASAREARLAARRWAGVIRSRVQQRLGQLQALVNAVSEVEGRKVLVLVTESLPLEPGREAFTSLAGAEKTTAGDAGTAFGDWNVIDIAAADWVDLTPIVNEIGRTAATNGISIYSVQAEYGIGAFVPGGDIGATMPGREAWDNPTAPPTRRINASRLQPSINLTSALTQSEKVENTGRLLRLLAEKTGGKSYVGAGAFDELVDGIVSDVKTYYSLGFRADAVVDAARRIEVRVKGRPGLRVRTREEVIRKSPEREMTDRVVARLFERNRSSELPIEVDSKRVSVAPDHAYRTYWVAARVPMSSLTFVPDGDTYKASFTVHYAAMGEDADFVSGTAGTQVVEVSAAQFAESQKQQYTYVVPMLLRPARHTVAIGVLDSISHLSGFATTEIDVQ